MVCNLTWVRWRKTPWDIFGTFHNPEDHVWVSGQWRQDSLKLVTQFSRSSFSHLDSLQRSVNTNGFSRPERRKNVREPMFDMSCRVPSGWLGPGPWVGQRMRWRSWSWRFIRRRWNGYSSWCLASGLWKKCWGECYSSWVQHNFVHRMWIDWRLECTATTGSSSVSMLHCPLRHNYFATSLTTSRTPQLLVERIYRRYISIWAISYATCLKLEV